MNSREELIALVQYMANHNISHTEELENLSKETSGVSLEKIEQAVAKYKEGNALLLEALDSLK